MSKKKPTQIDYGAYTPDMVDVEIIRVWLAQPEWTNGEIASSVSQSLKVNIDKEKVKRAVITARKEGWLEPSVPVETGLALKLSASADLADKPYKVRVLNTTSAEHVARAIARHVRDQITHELKDQEIIHIGFFGGRTNSFVAQFLVELFRQDSEGQGDDKPYKGPRRLVLHSLVGVLDSDDPDTDPNSFPVYFIHHRKVIESLLKRTLAFKKLTMPGLVTNEEFEHYRTSSLAVAHAFETRPKYDIIIASCGHHGCRYTLTDYIQTGFRDGSNVRAKLDELTNSLHERNVLGDIAWHPIIPDGKTVDLAELPLRVATLYTLPELQQLAASGSKTKIVLAVGPCSNDKCTISKSQHLRWLLQATPVPAHWIFVDRRSVQDYLEKK